MAITFVKLFAPALLTNAVATYYTVPALPVTSLLRNGRLRFTNTDSAAHAVTAYAVPNAGAAGITNMFCPAISVPPNNYIDVDVPQMGYGDIIRAFADTGSLVNIQAIDGVLQS